MALPAPGARLCPARTGLGAALGSPCAPHSPTSIHPSPGGLRGQVCPAAPGAVGTEETEQQLPGAANSPALRRGTPRRGAARAVSGPALAPCGAGSGDTAGVPCGAGRSGSPRSGLGRQCHLRLPVSPAGGTDPPEGSVAHQSIRHRCLLAGTAGSSSGGGKGAGGAAETPQHPSPSQPARTRSRARSRAGGLTRGRPTRVQPHARPLLARQRLTPGGCCLQPALAGTSSSCTYITPGCRSGGEGGAGTPARAPVPAPSGERWIYPVRGNWSERFPSSPGGCSELVPVGEGESETLSPGGAGRAGGRAKHLGCSLGQ